MPKVESFALRKLIDRVQAGQYVEWPWALLKDHFPAKTDAAARKQMQAWAAKNGIAAKMEDHEMTGGRTTHIVRVAVFRKPTRD